ncbi:hypothetical protein [Acinetobacter gerneri]|jgi:RNA binding exosome subunit|uniref:hypothetical protein n=1 Tax=Acinetobacter gerneri TaxID=202952 RepID=UPI0023EFFFA7|nr:hypothetical protein [Acinetobacter gerneri]MCH4245953.1 hypothetical protein [Acinetobacter gerneri]
MKNQIDLASLKQIYYFVLEKPEISQLTNYDKAIEFFRNLHDGDFDSFDVSMDKIEGQFGNKNTILLNFIPDFLEINEFLSWVINELRE